jgi:transcription initiation factor IIE alpha subunit
MLEDLFALLDFFKRTSSGLSVSQKQEVREKVLYALNATKNWIASNKDRDQNSAMISNIWRRTANDLREINLEEVHNLADLLESKSQHWTGYEVIQENISFSNIESLINSL